MDCSNLRQTLAILYMPSLFFPYPALKPVGEQSYWTINSQRRQWTSPPPQKKQGRLSSLQLLFQHRLASRESPWLFISFGLCLRSVWCANKEREGVQGKRVRVGDVLIKGNSEGLDQIILHNLVREDTAFDTEKMEMTCPQRPIPTVGDQSVVAKAIHFNHRGWWWVWHVYVQYSWSCAAQCGDHDSNTARLKTLNPMRDKEPEDVMILIVG